MLKNNSIEETFRNAFDNFEADVNEHVWANIQQNITPPAAPNVVKPLSEASKIVTSSGKFSGLFYGIVSTAIIAVVGVSYIYLKPDKKDSIKNNEVVTSTSVPVLTNNTAPAPIDLAAEEKHENTLVSQKEPEKNKREGLVRNKPDDKTTNAENGIAQVSEVTAVEKTVSSKSNTTGLNSQDKSELSAEEKSLNNQSVAVESQETTPENENQASNVLPLEKPSENDDFNWGVIANSISPNNDGKNDSFKIKTTGLSSIEVTIYDPKNGKIIYKWNTLDGAWDGKDFNGKEMPAGFYLYAIFAQSVDGKPHSTKGTIYIFR